MKSLRGFLSSRWAWASSMHFGVGSMPRIFLNPDEARPSARIPAPQPISSTDEFAWKFENACLFGISVG